MKRRILPLALLPIVPLVLATPLALPISLVASTKAFAQSDESDRFDALFGEDESVPCDMQMDSTSDDETDECGPAKAKISKDGMGEADEILTMLDQLDEEDDTAAEEPGENAPAQSRGAGSSSADNTGAAGNSADMSLSDSETTLPPPGGQAGDEAGNEAGNQAGSDNTGTATSEDFAAENANAATPEAQPERFTIVNATAADDLAAADAGYSADGTFDSLADVSTVPGTSEDALLDVTLGDALDPLADPLSPALDGINDLGAAVGAPLGNTLSPVLEPAAGALP